MENEDFLLKSVSYFWRNYAVVDKKYKSANGNYWINKIYKNNKLVLEKKEKSDVDKTVKDLGKELFNFVGML